MTGAKTAQRRLLSLKPGQIVFHPPMNLSSSVSAAGGAMDPLARPGDGPGDKRSGSERRAVGFWQPFNEWWRAEYERLNRRPSGLEIQR